MTREEVKQLKPGDTVFIRATFKKILDDGDVLFLHTQTSLDDEVEKTKEYTLPDNVMLPPPAPKYDPCRRFKKGDEVRVVVWNGRTCLRDGQVGFVVRDEEALGMVELSIDGRKNGVFYHACHLELVTPVEELEPYYVGTWENMLAVYKKTQTEDIIISMFSQSHPHAKEAAEAECARFNEEYRKEQK